MLPFDWDVHIRNVVQDKIDKRFVPIFADVFYERLRLERLPRSVCCQSILGERIIKIVDDYQGYQTYVNKHDSVSDTVAASYRQLF